MELRARTASQTPPAPVIEWSRRHFAHYFFAPTSRMHSALCARLPRLRPGERLAVIAPRGSAKSTLVSFAWPLYLALSGRQRYILLVAETTDQARRYLESIQNELTGNDGLQAEYPDAAGEGAPWNADRIVLRNGAQIEAAGTGTSIRGRKHAQSRPSLVIIDDPQDRKHITSVPQRQAHWRWFTQDLLNVGGPETIFVAVGTALHRDALIDRLMAQPGWEAMKFPSVESWPWNLSLWKEWERAYTDRSNPNRERAALQFYEERRAAMEEGAVVCWPEREGLYALMRLRVDIGRSAFESEKQGNPTNPESCEWPDEYFSESIWFTDWPQSLRLRAMALDPSKGNDSRFGDYSAYVMLGIDGDGTLFVEADLARRSAEQIVRDGVEWFVHFRPDVFGCESAMYHDLLAADFEEAFLARGILGARPLAITNTLAKEVRIRRLGPFLSQRRLRFRSGSPGTRLLVEQMREFPTGDHDDGPDALEMAVRLAADFLCGAQAERLGGRLTHE
ncbi:MAG: hypothetical protein HYS13_21460 [Planctomycetia bacterium]|nr:hypothetical protein [Planctomycetia bacterium]